MAKVATKPLKSAKESQAPAKGGRLPDAAVIAQRALVSALAEGGRTVEGHNYIPHGTRVVHQEDWRRCAYRKGISTREGRARQLAFERAVARLVRDGLVAVCEKEYWPMQPTA